MFFFRDWRYEYDKGRAQKRLNWREDSEAIGSR